MTVSTRTTVHLTRDPARIEAYIDEVGCVVLNAGEQFGGTGVTIFQTREQAAEMARKLLAAAEKVEVAA